MMHSGYAGYEDAVILKLMQLASAVLLGSVSYCYPKLVSQTG